MTQAYLDFINLCDKNPKSTYQPDLVLDCANGVGAVPMEQIAKLVSPHLKIKLINTQIKNTAKLNEGCGAEYVHKDMKEPTELTSTMPAKCAAFDGDADRLIYFKRMGANKSPSIIDGDKQFATLMMYIK